MKRSHKSEVLALLSKQIGNEEEVEEIERTAELVSLEWVDPCQAGGQHTNGLMYGLVQSGKTGVLVTTGAIGADKGYRLVVILTSDIDPLYNQTLGRVQQAFPGMDVIDKAGVKDLEAFGQRVRGGVCAIVITKNARILESLIENFKKVRVPGLSCLMIDDEADQASLNTRAHKDDGIRSAINQRLTDLRAFFERSTYLQVTATPQALFLQGPEHPFRPKFTVLSHPGGQYVGGDDFFGEPSQLVREFGAADIELLAGGGQPRPAKTLPSSLIRALDTFLIGATFKRLQDPEQNCAFLCHVSTKKADHEFISRLLLKYKNELKEGLDRRDANLARRLSEAFEDLLQTDSRLQGHLPEIKDALSFYASSITVKLVNGDTDEDVAVKAPYNLFVGGNKLGRGVTIRNLLVSYYGRNPKSPQADTVLQHARMYGYRGADKGLLRLFLPPELHRVFKAINKMEVGLRELVAQRPSEEFRGIYVSSGLSPTRRNVLVPGAVGVYAAGSNYNPARVMMDDSVKSHTDRIDAMLRGIDSKTARKVELAVALEMLGEVRVESGGDGVWDTEAIKGSIEQFKAVRPNAEIVVYVDRDRALIERRRETQGIIDGGELDRVPQDALVIFMLRTKAAGNRSAAWWPQVRFPSGNYAFAFAI